MDVLDEPLITRHRLTVDEYARMAEAGVLAPDARVELIDGEVIDRAPMGTRHRATVMRLGRLLERAVGDAAQVSSQLPIRLGANNEPKPDLALLRPRADFYTDVMPTGTDCLLVIEVADTTLPYDVRIKGPLYARHGVPEYWVFDLPGRQLRIFRQPQLDAYAEASVVRQPGRLPLPGLVDVHIDLTGVL
jgi:Uma2 family endonuclease